jgi:hypothetical protein
VALHCGPLLAGLDDGLGAGGARRARGAAGRCLRRLAAAAAAPAEAVGWARRRLALDPLDEDAARELMRRMAAGGDRTGALAVYDRLSDRLRTSLGLAPSAQTRTLAATLRGPEAAPRRTAVDGPPLIGRRRELTVITELWERVTAGAGAVLILAARAGSARPAWPPSWSRAPASPAMRARPAAARSISAAPPPFAPWIELLADLARELAPPPPTAMAGGARPAVAVAAAPLGRPRATAADVPPELARARLFEAAVELAEHATADRPLVLVFDDVHLADVPTLELAAYLARRIEHCRCCSCSPPHDAAPRRGRRARPGGARPRRRRPRARAATARARRGRGAGGSGQRP